MLVIAFAIRLTPCFSRIASAISRANSTVPVMNDLVNEVGINFRNIFLEESFFTEEFEVSNSIKILDINIVVNEKQLIRDLNLNVVPGDIVGIEGPSGTGKTMLLETIAGLRYPTSGRIVMPSKYSKNMAYLKQDAHIMNENVEENIRFLRESLHNTVITNLIIKLQIPNLGNLSNNLNPDVFSGGERQRLALARTFANQPNLVFLDEPTSAQDGKRRDLILELISGGENRIIFICTHSKEILARCTKSIKLG
jgi:ABC-type multidrug transport system ATPase subunit